MSRYSILILLAALLVAGSTVAQSPQHALPTSLYADRKAFGVGDVVTILIMEYSQGSNEAATNTGVDHSIDASTEGASGTSILGSFGVKAGIKSDQKSNGNTTRAGSLKGKLTARIVELLPNDHLKIEGQRKVIINGEEQVTIISGLVRRADILSDNTIYSYLMSDATISYKGRGIVDEAQKPGWISRGINWLF